MKNLILVDGNNLLFRSYYATAYNGNFMKNSKGFPTNALFGFNNMINKIILEEKPTYMIVAFDKGKTFRHDKFEVYKGKRLEMPDELKQQFPVAKELLTYLGIKYYDIDNYEADDIIGTFSEYCNKDDNYTGTIISSDKDLLQLITDEVDIKLLKPKDYIRYNKESFIKEWGIEPIRIIDLKALMGDQSDNIPGVKGIGEKTALKLLQEYKTLDGIYENIDKIKGATKDKLLQDKDNAYMSYEIATIVKDVPVDIDINDIKLKEKDDKKLNDLYEELEFYSFLKKEKVVKKEEILDIKIIDKLPELKETVSIYLELDNSNYHKANILGLGVYSKETCCFIKEDDIEKNIEILSKVNKYTYDIKRIYVALKHRNLCLKNFSFDTLIAANLLDYNTKEDVAYLANQNDYDVFFKNTIENINTFAYNAIMKAKFIYETKEKFENELKNKDMYYIFNDIEMPLTYVLGDMELNGIKIDREELIIMGNEIKDNIKLISEDIYSLANQEFNISSPQQLGEILFEKLGLPHSKKGKTGYSTAIEVLNKLKDKHPIITKIIEYRMLTKLYTTYIEGLLNSISEDGKIHTIYMQTLTKTGRLSSIEPNLQNIPTRNEYGRLIRKAFIPSYDILISGDYSQIELRILAALADIGTLIESFNNGIDVHTKTACDLFNVSEPSKDQRRIAKTVNFGIIYGISSFGLSENLNISPKEAQSFIDRYNTIYPGIKEYMERVIENAKKDGYVKTLFGRRRYIPEILNKNYLIRSAGERMAINAPIQGTSADIIKIAMINIDKKFKENNIQSKMILQIHDELVFDTLESEKEKVIEIVTNEMENVYKFAVPLKVDIEFGNNLYQAK